MTDLLKLGHKLLRDYHPELEERFYEIDYLLGKHILNQMTKKGLTQQQLADMCEVPLKTIHRVQGGNKDTSVETYITIFKKLDKTIVDEIDIVDESITKYILYIGLHDHEFLETLDGTLEDYKDALLKLKNRK